MSSLFAGLAFTTPLALLGLLALPLIWWLLRFNPPHPQQVRFPPYRLLLELISKEEQPQHTPWWLLLLRMALAAAIIFAVAGPLLNASSVRDRSADPLLLVVDDGWASAQDWQPRAQLITTSCPKLNVLARLQPLPAQQARQPRANLACRMPPQPPAWQAHSTPAHWSRNAANSAQELKAAFANTASLRVLWLSDGLTYEGDGSFNTDLAALAGGNARVEVLQPDCRRHSGCREAARTGTGKAEHLGGARFIRHEPSSPRSVCARSTVARWQKRS
jgi:hypothetical protein